MTDETRQSSSETAYERLRMLILEGGLLAGEPLRVSTLAASFGFGLTPLREALTRLQSEHLVTANFNRGFKVADSSIDELTDLGRVRAMIDTQMLCEAIEHGGQDWEGALVAAHYQLSRTAVPALGDPPEHYRAWDRQHTAFHEALTAASRSQWMSRFAAQISDQLRRYHSNILIESTGATARDAGLRAELEATARRVMALDGHTHLMDAALARDRDTAVRLMREHVQLSSHAYRKLQDVLTGLAAEKAHGDARQ